MISLIKLFVTSCKRYSYGYNLTSILCGKADKGEVRLGEVVSTEGSGRDLVC